MCQNARKGRQNDKGKEDVNMGKRYTKIGPAARRLGINTDTLYGGRGWDLQKGTAEAGPTGCRNSPGGAGFFATLRKP